MMSRWSALLLAAMPLFMVGRQESEGEAVFSAKSAQFTDSRHDPTKPLTVQIVGRDCRWEVTYPGRDGELATGDDIAVGNRLCLPSGVSVRLILQSADFVYSFALPELNLREIAVPDMTFSLSFTPAEPGAFTLRGGELCGDRRNELSGTIVVQSPAEWNAWLHQAGGGHD